MFLVKHIRGTDRLFDNLHTNRESTRTLPIERTQNKYEEETRSFRCRIEKRRRR